MREAPTGVEIRAGTTPEAAEVEAKMGKAPSVAIALHMEAHCAAGYTIEYRKKLGIFISIFLEMGMNILTQDDYGGSGLLSMRRMRRDCSRFPSEKMGMERPEEGTRTM